MPHPSLRPKPRPPSPRRRRGSRRPAWLARQLFWLSLGTVPVMAQQTGAAAEDAGTGSAPRGWSVSTRFTATTELSHVQGPAAGPSGSGSEWVTQAGPGIQITSRSGRVRGTLDAVLLGTVYARRSELSDVTGSLSLNGRAELVPGWAAVDAVASVSQQNTSPYGLQSAAGSSLRTSADRREVANLSVSPYVSGLLGDFAEYNLRYTLQTVQTRGGSVDDSRNQVLSAVLRSRPGPQVGWELQGTSQRVAFDAGRATTLERGVASLIWQPDVDLRFALRAGGERTDVGLDDKESYATWGAGVRWTPTPRTTLAADVDRRYFGTGYQLLAEHRFRRAVVRVSSARDTTTGTGAGGVGQPITLLQLYLLQYASVEPDPLLRELRVRELLRLNNQNPGTLVNAGFGIGAVSLQQRSDAALSLLGARTNVTLQAFATSTRTLDRVSPGASGPQRVRQAGVGGSASHRLTPATSLTLAFSHARNRDTLPVAQSGEALRSSSLLVGLNTQLNARTTASVGLRHTREQQGAPFTTRETAVSASVNVRF